MRRPKHKFSGCLLLATLLLGLMLFAQPQLAERRPALVEWREPRLAQLSVYGEQAHIELKPGFGSLVLLQSEEQAQIYRPNPYINQGIYLPALSSGLYHIYAGDLSVRASRDYLLEGYTINRRGGRLHYRFFASEGRLKLQISEAAELPEDVYDVVIDAGHGGANIGANPGQRQEKAENLRASLYMAELFQARGLKVALTRSGDYIPGQPGISAAEINPYIENGRIDLCYQAAGKYFISNHLNASTTAAYRGYQLYTSVRADKAWAGAVAAALNQAGHTANDTFLTFGRYGIYKRYSQDNPDTNSDYYYVLRETGGLATSARNYAAAFPKRDLRQGAEAMLVEYLFLDNRADRDYWDENWPALVEAVVAGCCQYWNL